MARSGRVAVPVLLCLGLVAFVSQSSVFVPAPQSNNRLPAAAAVAAPALLAGAPAAFADAIGDAAAKFSDATYPIAEKINWGNTPIISSYFATESARNPKAVSQAVDKLLESGLTMDPALIKAAVAAHDKALKSAASNPNLMTSKADFAAVNEALARMIASANKARCIPEALIRQHMSAFDLLKVAVHAAGQVLQAFGRLPGQQAATHLVLVQASETEARLSTARRVR